MPRKNPQLSYAREQLDQHLCKLRAKYLQGDLLNTLLHPPPADLDKIIQEALNNVPPKNDPQDLPPDKKPKIRTIKNDFEKLTDLIVEVAREMGRKQIDLGKLKGILRRIDHDDPKMCAWEFAEKLAKQIAAIPQPPKTWILRQAKTGLPNRPNAKERLEWALNALDADDLPELPTFAGGAKPSKEQVEEFWKLLAILLKHDGEKKSHFTPKLDRDGSALAGYIRFLEMKVWQVRWKYCLDRRLEPLTAWLYSLQDPDIDSKLRETLHGQALTPEQMKVALEKLQATERKRRSRANPGPKAG